MVVVVGSALSFLHTFKPGCSKRNSATWGTMTVRQQLQQLSHGVFLRLGSSWMTGRPPRIVSGELKSSRGLGRRYGRGKDVWIFDRPKQLFVESSGFSKLVGRPISSCCLMSSWCNLSAQTKTLLLSRWGSILGPDLFSLGIASKMPKAPFYTLPNEDVKPPLKTKWDLF